MYATLNCEQTKSKRSTRRKEQNKRAKKLSGKKKFTTDQNRLSNQNKSNKKEARQYLSKTRQDCGMVENGWRFMIRQNTLATRQGKTKTVYTPEKGAQVETIRVKGRLGPVTQEKGQVT